MEYNEIKPLWSSYEMRSHYEEVFNNFIRANSLFATMCASASILFVSAAAKSAQFSLHVQLLDAKEGPTTILALIHASQSYLT